MDKYIALLRGINVSGQKKIRMEDLRNLLARLNFKHLQTYIQSGNIIFEYKKTPPEKLAKRIGDAIRDHYDFDVPVIIRTPDQLQTALNEHPFLKETDIDVKGLYIAFLNEIPLDEDIEKTVLIQYPPDRYQITGDLVYIHYATSAGNSKLTNNFLEKKLKRQATSRNLNTVKELIRLAAVE